MLFSLINHTGRWIIILVILGIHPCIQGQKIGKLDLSKMDTYVEESRQAWLVPGLSLAIIKDDSVVFAKGYGYRESGKPGKVDENTLFSIASITKGFTATALAILDDRGELDWDDPVRKYLPDFTLYNDYVNEEIRIRDLLCHRSGLGTFSGDLVWYETDYSREEVLQRARYLEPTVGFRYGFGYSNICYLAAGQIIPAAVEKSWDLFIQDEILDPLGMNRTHISLDDVLVDPNRATPHHVDLNDSLICTIPYMNWHSVAPAAGLNSTVMDICRWMRFQLNMGNWEGRQLVSMENLWETRELNNSQPPDAGSARFWPSRHFAGYGLGWEMYDYHGCKVIAHEGGSDGMLSRIIMVPEENLGFIILTNSLSAITAGLEYYLLDQYHEGESYDWCGIYLQSASGYLDHMDSEWKEYKSNADRSIRPTHKLKEYTGTYSCQLYGDVVISLEKKNLVLDFLPSERMIADLEPFSGDTFLIRIRDFPYFPEGTVTFELNGSEEIEGLEIDIAVPDFHFSELDLKKVR